MSELLSLIKPHITEGNHKIEYDLAENNALTKASKATANESTSENVIATAVLPEGCTIVGENTHVFIENGSHTFTYVDPNDEEHTIVAEVNWITKVVEDVTEPETTPDVSKEETIPDNTEVGIP